MSNIQPAAFVAATLAFLSIAFIFWVTVGQMVGVCAIPGAMPSAEIRAETKPAQSAAKPEPNKTIKKGKTDANRK